MRVHPQFGEYCLYRDDKSVAFLCDDRALLNPTSPLSAGTPELARQEVFPGLKLYYVASEESRDT